MTTLTPGSPTPAADRRFLTVIAVLSVVIPAVVALLLYVPQTGKLGAVDVRFIPKVNAVLNSLTALCLAAGFYFIRQQNVRVHRALMLTAFVLSSCFLVLYVLYHFQAPSTHFGGTGWIRPIYFFLLLSHILLAVTVVPLALTALYFALSNQIPRHRRVVRWTLPVWLYVSVTGVIVYLLISPYYAA